MPLRQAGLLVELLKCALPSVSFVDTGHGLSYDHCRHMPYLGRRRTVDASLVFILALNLGLGVSVLIYLWQYRRSRRTEVVEHQILSEPIFPERVSDLLFRGSILWCLSHLFSFGQNYITSKDLELAFFTAGTMYVVHGLAYLSGYPVRERGIPPDLKRFDSLRTISLGVLVVVTLFALAADLTQKNIPADSEIKPWTLSFIYPLWILMIYAHTWWSLRFSAHSLRQLVRIILASGGFYALSCLISDTDTGFHAFQTLLLISMIVLLHRSALRHIDSAFERTNFFRREKEVVVSFITHVTGSESRIKNKNTQEGQVGTLDLDYVLKTTLRFAMELTEAGAGAIFMFEPYEAEGRLRWRHKELIPRAVDGLYPPLTDITHLPYVSMRQKYLNDLLLSERHPIDSGLPGLVAERSESLLIGNALEDPRVIQQKEDFLKIRTALAVPLKVQNELVGVVCVINRHGDRTFTQEDVTLLEAMAEQAAIAIGTAVMHLELREKERLEREIEIAREVQRLLLPTHCPKIEGFSLAAFSKAAQQVGGDYYDFVTHASGEITIVIADVSGKGVPAALTMAMVRSALRALGPPSHGPKDLLVRINRFIEEDLRRDMFISMLAVTLNPATRHLRVARAGHDPLLQISGNGQEPKLMQPDGIALGLVKSEQFESFTEEIEFEVCDGERYVLFTDGVTEAMNEAGEEYSLDRLSQDLKQSLQDPPDQAINAVRDSVAGFVKTAPQHDDITLLVLDVLQEDGSEKSQIEAALTS